MVKMLPILLSILIPSTIGAQINTLFVRQGTTLHRNLGPNFQIPPASLTAFVTIFMMITIVLYDRLLIPFIRKYTNNPRGITLLQKLGCGLLLQVIVMVIACLAERKRLSVARQNNALNKDDKIPLSIYFSLSMP